MKVLLELEKNLFNIEFSQERKCFNLASAAILVIYAYFAFMSIVLRSDSRVIATLFICGFFSYGLYYIGTLTQNYSLISIITAVILNLLVIPTCYIANKELISPVFIMFIIGIIYVIISLNGIKMYLMLTLSLIAVICSIINVYFEYGTSMYQSNNVSVEVFIPTVLNMLVVGNVAGIAVKMLMKIYDQEQIKTAGIVKSSELLSDSKDTFLSNMSHEIRTPMNAILGTSQLLLENDLDDDSRDKVLNILNATNALLSSINDMLDITRIETGAIKIEEEEYDFGDMLSDIINMIAVRVMDRNIEFIVNVDADIPKMLYGDGKRIRQVFINLLNNAVKYTKEGSITLEVKKESCVDNVVKIAVSVKDTGIGIKEIDKTRILAELNQLDNNPSAIENVEGGLGLFICKEIMKAMQGTFDIYSKYNEGSKFSFSVPQKVMSDTALLVDKSEEFSRYKVLLFEKSEECNSAINLALDNLGIEVDSAYGTEMFRSMFIGGTYSHIILDRKNYETLHTFLAPRLNETKLVVVADINQTDATGIPGTILIRPVYSVNLNDYFIGKRHSLIRRINVRGNFIAPDATVMTVDDNLTNLRVVEKILEKYQMKVLTASGGREALLKLEREKVDMIFLDYMMPDMDGVDTLKNIRAMDAEWTNSVPIVALTANAVGGVREMLLSEGFDDYISKPIEMSKLERSLLKFLREDLIKQPEIGE